MKKTLKRSQEVSLKIGSALVTFFIWFMISTIIWIGIMLIIIAAQRSAGDLIVPGAYTTEHFTVINEGVTKDEAKNFGDHLERTHQAILADLGVSEMPHAIVHLYRDGNREFHDRYDIYRNTKDLGGFVENTSLDEIHVQWVRNEDARHSALADITEEVRIGSIGEHEFVHLVEHNVLYQEARRERSARSRAHWELSCRLGGPYCNTPKWFSESLAQYEAGRWGSKALLEEYESRAETLAPTKFNLDDTYTYGMLVGEYIEKEWGKSAFKKMIVAHANTQEALGVSEEQFNAGFRAYAAERMKGLLLQYKYTGEILF